MTSIYCFTESPLGRLLLAGTGDTLALIGFPSGSMARVPERRWRFEESAFAAARTQLDEYFAGNRTHFTLRLASQGTPFQRAVWGALREIPFGALRSYADVARSIEKPSAVRAVGHANGQNPLPIVVPCHRVIGSSGALTGFGGGMAAKRWLLAHEGVRLDEQRDRVALATTKVALHA